MSDPTTRAADAGAHDTAARVVLTYAVEAVPEDLRFWVHDELTGEPFESSFRPRHDTASEGDRFGEFVSRGCGVPVDVTLRVDSVTGGTRLDAETEVVIERAD